MAPRLTRRHFLFASLAVPATVAAGSGPALASVTVDEHGTFTSAAAEYGVPTAVLAAFSWSQTRWQDHDGAPSTSAGYGPMHLVDGETAAQARIRSGKSRTEVIDTLGAAAALTGLSREALRADPQANIRGGAAVLADTQRRLGNPVGARSDAAQWYAAVAASSGLTSASAQVSFADHVVETVRSGATLSLADGSSLVLGAKSVGPVDRQRSELARRAVASAARGKASSPFDAPKGLDIEWVAAPYEQYGPNPWDYGNHDLGNRPKDPKITHIVIHNTEGQWDGVLAMVQDPTYVSWQYSLRSSDGHVAQHLLPEDVAWHAGNWWINAHSIGLEHEGFAAEGMAWYSEPMYRSSAALVRYLCKEYDIPMDRDHIIGHDQVPGVTTPNIPGMHWDPGPYWDWEHYFHLLGADLDRAVSRRALRIGDVARILPGFAGNAQIIEGTPRDTNFVTLHVAPSADADLVNDIGLHQFGQPASTGVSDTSARANAGTDFVVADIRGDWTAIWFLGVKAWFLNPPSRPTARPVSRRTMTVTPRGETAATYGRCYPEAEAYSNPDDVQTVSPLIYTLPAGQSYVVTDLHPHTDYYKAQTFSPDTPGDHVSITGKDRYVQISHGHRITFVRLADVVVS